MDIVLKIRRKEWKQKGLLGFPQTRTEKWGKLLTRSKRKEICTTTTGGMKRDWVDLLSLFTKGGKKGNMNTRDGGLKAFQREKA